MPRKTTMKKKNNVKRKRGRGFIGDALGSVISPFTTAY
jgi:hypothetical protein